MGKSVAFFVSPHGFGHAARSCAVMQSLLELDNSLQLSILTTVPRWFFSASLSTPFNYFSVRTDIGMVQNDPLRENLKGTLAELETFLPFSQASLKEVKEILNGERCELVIADISPLGIQAAREVGIASVLLENFTWDWIYRGYLEQEPGLGRFADYLEALYAHAAWRIKAEPFCQDGRADLVCKPVCRLPQMKRQLTRAKLGIDPEAWVIIVSMGGIRSSLPNMECFRSLSNSLFIVPGPGDERVRKGNFIFLPYQTEFYHPDLIEASDVVIGKVGYSTLAETYQTGKPFGFVPRMGFPESRKLEAFINSCMAGVEIKETEYRRGDWLAKLEELMVLPRITRDRPFGADQAAKFILERLNGSPLTENGNGTRVKNERRFG